MLSSVAPGIAAYARAVELERAKNYSEARSEYEASLRAGYLTAAEPLGVLYLHGKGGEPDKPAAFVCFQRAVSAGAPNPKILLNLAEMLYYGDGIAKDMRAAAGYYQQLLAHAGADEKTRQRARTQIDKLNIVFAAEDREVAREEELRLARAAAVAAEEEVVLLREEHERIRREAASAAPAMPFMEIHADDIEYVLNESGAPKKLGEGHFGQVLEGRYAGVRVAIKQLKVSVLTSAEQRAFRAEAAVHASMRHPNIVMLLAVCVEEGCFALVMEYMTGGSLYRLLHSDVVLSWPQRIDMAKQLVAGVMYLHGLRDHIIHRDLKSENVLVTRPYRADERIELKIGDFGLAQIKKAASATSKVGVGGTVQWVAPEGFTGSGLTKKSDIYSLAVLFWELASRCDPYADLIGMPAIMHKIVTGQTNPIPAETPPEFAVIIQDCWKLEPDERPTARDLMPRIDALAAGFFSGGASAGAGAGGGEASAAGAMYDRPRPTYH